jgi:hypothetical protein
MKLKVFPLLVLFVPTTSVFAQSPEELKHQLDEAERRIVRLQPTAFPNLPPQVARMLKSRGCTIPQEAYTKKPHNVIKGEFTKPGQTDWAVLCSRKGASSILVFEGGALNKPAEIARMEDRIFLQGLTAANIGFSRGINPVSGDIILKHFQAYGGPKPPPIDHQGIDDAFIEKASVTWYFYHGKWVQLTGSD